MEGPHCAQFVSKSLGLPTIGSARELEKYAAEHGWMLSKTPQVGSIVAYNNGLGPPRSGRHVGYVNSSNTYAHIPSGNQIKVSRIPTNASGLKFWNPPANYDITQMDQGLLTQAARQSIYADRMRLGRDIKKDQQAMLVAAISGKSDLLAQGTSIFEMNAVGMRPFDYAGIRAGMGQGPLPTTTQYMDELIGMDERLGRPKGRLKGMTMEQIVTNAQSLELSKDQLDIAEKYFAVKKEALEVEISLRNEEDAALANIEEQYKWNKKIYGLRGDLAERIRDRSMQEWRMGRFEFAAGGRQSEYAIAAAGRQIRPIGTTSSEEARIAYQQAIAEENAYNQQVMKSPALWGSENVISKQRELRKARIESYVGVVSTGYDERVARRQLENIKAEYAYELGMVDPVQRRAQLENEIAYLYTADGMRGREGTAQLDQERVESNKKLLDYLKERRDIERGIAEQQRQMTGLAFGGRGLATPLTEFADKWNEAMSRMGMPDVKGPQRDQYISDLGDMLLEQKQTWESAYQDIGQSVVDIMSDYLDNPNGKSLLTAISGVYRNIGKMWLQNFVMQSGVGGSFIGSLTDMSQKAGQNGLNRQQIAAYTDQYKSELGTNDTSLVRLTTAINTLTSVISGGTAGTIAPGMGATGTVGGTVGAGLTALPLAVMGAAVASGVSSTGWPTSLNVIGRSSDATSATVPGKSGVKRLAGSDRIGGYMGAVTGLMGVYGASQGQGGVLSGAAAGYSAASSIAALRGASLSALGPWGIGIGVVAGLMGKHRGKPEPEHSYMSPSAGANTLWSSPALLHLGRPAFGSGRAWSSPAGMSTKDQYNITVNINAGQVDINNPTLLARKVGDALATDLSRQSRSGLKMRLRD